MKKINRLLYIIGLVAVTLTLSLSVVACENTNKESENSKTTSYKDVYALSAVIGANYLNHLNATDIKAVNFSVIDDSVSKNGIVSVSEVDGRPSEFSQQTVSDIKNCLLAFDSVLGGGITHTISKNKRTEGDFAQYAFVMNISVNGFNTKIYYDELYTETETEVDDDDGSEEFEENTYIKGVIIYGGDVFDVYGKREIEREKGEYSYSIEFITKIDENNFFKISYETETENHKTETSYEYEVVVNGKTVAETEFSIENKNGKTEVEFEVENKSANNKTKYEIVKKDGYDTYCINAKLLGKKYIIIAEKTQSGYVFVYSNGYREDIITA